MLVLEIIIAIIVIGSGIVFGIAAYMAFTTSCYDAIDEFMYRTTGFICGVLAIFAFITGGIIMKTI